MKKILLLLSITFMSIAAANAQCVPDPQFTSPGIYPDSAAGFASACVGEIYEQVITNVVPVDTCVVLIPFTPCSTVVFDSIVITSFTGLPASLSYACSTSLGGCSFAGATTGCVIITGTPTLAEIGNYPLTITVDVYVGGLASPNPGTTPQIVDWYSIDVLPAGSCTSGISEESTSDINLYPNPTENILTLNGLDGNTESITITNASGQLINTFNSITSSSAELDVRDLESGIYFVHVNNGDASEVIRFVKK